jgi:hypothetical protein
MIGMERSAQWPALRLDDWWPTYATLHRWTQIVGKTRLALSPFENHWWHCALYVSARGLRTPPMTYEGGYVDIEFNFLGDALIAHTSEGDAQSLRLEKKSVAQFFKEYRLMLSALGVRVHIAPSPNEVADGTPFADDHGHAAYDAHAVRRWWTALANADRALKKFRSRFLGKCSPSHFWWGGFDLACTRFSGRPAPIHPGGMPNTPDYVMREAYSHECISAGWWPGTPDTPVTEPAFYSYAYPVPQGCDIAAIAPAAAMYQPDLREWILPYEAVRAASDPDAMIAEFLESTYEAAAGLAGWDVASLRASATGHDLHPAIR